jgi:hypothetical protein
VRLIEAMPDLPRLGDILVDVGAISRHQLQQALQAQHQTATPDGAAARLGEVLESIDRPQPAPRRQRRRSKTSASSACRPTGWTR